MSASETADAVPPASALDPMLAHLNASPPRTWSLIITMFGDAFVPRGHAVWLGTLFLAFQALGISDGAVRTAMSRLTADKWLTRTKIGRNSYYRLAAEGSAAFAQASNTIYSRRPPPWCGHFEMLLIDPVADPSAIIAATEAGYGSPAPGVWIAPGGSRFRAHNAIHTVITGAAGDLRALAARAWPLDGRADDYARFLDAFAPLGTALTSGLVLSDRDAFLARTLLIHAYRRIVLRDPLLPPDVLPADWPGTPARMLCAAIYRRLLVPSERWLDANALGEDGQALSANPDVVGARFRD